MHILNYHVSDFLKPLALLTEALTEIGATNGDLVSDT